MHQEAIREKIRASQLVNRLENHILDDIDMTATQVTAALGLLRKCVPDLKAEEIDVTHDIGEGLKREIHKHYGRATE
jgi:hypothetical protein